MGELILIFRQPSVDLDTCELFAATNDEIARYAVIKGDIFFTRSSLKLEGIAQTSFIDSDPESAVFECHVMRLRPDTSKVSPKFLKEWCVWIYARRHFMANAKQVTMTTISQDGIFGLLCPMASLHEQMKIVEKVEAIY
jgi:type I restriction enzyme S subunit